MSVAPADDAHLQDLAVRVGQHLLAAQSRLVTAESCTGGFVAKLLTDIAGSSKWFECGFVTYSNVAKQRDLAVRAETLQRHGAVSAATVLEMAQGAQARSGAEVAIAVSGVAGPEGGTLVNPVGSVWFARLWLSDGEVLTNTVHRQFAGDRAAIRRAAAGFALELVLDAGFTS